MYSLRNIRYLAHNCRCFRCVRYYFSRCLLLLYAIALGYSSTLPAGDTYPECFPAESAWENIEFETPLSGNQTPKSRLEEREVTLTFNRFESYLPQFYGFAFLKKEIQDIPEITERSAFEEQFRDVNLVTLGSKHTAGDDDISAYRFTPPTEGTWVIYLVAAINKIPFLEQKNLRISPKVENVRGGSIFSGSSLNLVEPIDFKACVIALEP